MMAEGIWICSHKYFIRRHKHAKQVAIFLDMFSFQILGTTIYEGMQMSVLCGIHSYT
jgi:hypothetical protein